MTKRLDILVNLIKQGNGGKLAKDDLGGVELSAKEAEISVKALDTKYQELVQEISKGNKTIGDAQREYRDFAKQLGVVESQSNDTQLNIITLNQALELGQKAFSAVSQAAEIAFENLQQAERIEALRNTFDNLAGSLGNTDDLLNRLRASTSGAVNQTVLMEAANKALNLRLATTDEELIKLVSNAAALGANLGDVGGTIDDVLAAIANESKLRLDNFGVAASRVEELQAQLQAAGEEGTFAQAVMIALEETVDKTGARANLAADDMSRLQAAMQDAKDEALIELISALGDDLPDAVDNAIGAINRFSDAIDSDKLRSFYEFMVTGNRIARAFASAGLSELSRGLENVDEEVSRNQLPVYVRHLEAVAVAIEAPATGMVNWNAIIEETEESIDGLIRSTEGLTEEQIAQNLHMLRTLGVARQYTASMNRMGDDYELLEPPARRANRAIQGTGEAANDASEELDYLATRAEILADAAQRAADAQAEHSAVLGGYFVDISQAGDETQTAAEYLYGLASAGELSIDAVSGLAVSLGQMTPEMAQAYIEAAILRGNLDDLYQAIRTGKLDVDLADEAIDALTSGLAGNAQEAINAATAAALFNEEINKIPDVTVKKLVFEVDGAGQVTSVGNVNAPAVISSHYGGPAAAGQPHLVGDGPGGSYIPGATELFIPGQSGYIVSNQQVERALQNISNRTVHYSDRSSVNFNMRGLNVRQAGRSLNRSRRQHLNRSLYG